MTANNHFSPNILLNNLIEAAGGQLPECPKQASSSILTTVHWTAAFLPSFFCSLFLRSARGNILILIKMPHRTRSMTALWVFTGLNFILVSTITPVYDFVCFLPYWERRVYF
ncbi:hypothetical protein SLA2020_029890 [Shorea laevis]